MKKFKIQFLVRIGFQMWKIQNSVFSENWISKMKNSKPVFSEIGFSNVKIQNSVFSENWWEKVCNVYHFTFKIHTIGPVIEEEIGTFPIDSHYLF
jgi:hypothetical protein